MAIWPKTRYNAIINTLKLPKSKYKSKMFQQLSRFTSRVFKIGFIFYKKKNGFFTFMKNF